MFRAWRDWPGMRGLRLALLGHAVVGAFFVGAVSAVVCLIGWSDVYREPSAGRIALAIAETLGCVLICLAARWGERYLKKQCVRRYLCSGP